MHTSIDAKIKLIIVLLLIPSPKNIAVNAVKVIIPIANPKNRPGQSSSSNATNEYFVAIRYK
jgi:hypothetical protein